MAELMKVYKCELCGNIVEVLHDGKVDLVCFSQPMKLLAENVTDAAKEKHVPVVEKTAEGWKVTVGSVLHPMEPDHYIEWIELVVGQAEGGEVHRKASPFKTESSTSACCSAMSRGTQDRAFCAGQSGQSPSS